MRKVRQILRLAYELKLSYRNIAKSLGISRRVVTDTLTRAAAAKLKWPIPLDVEDAGLEEKLFPKMPAPRMRRPEPNWEVVYQELKIKGATLLILHAEYLAEHPDGIGYSFYCEGYRGWLKTQKRYMRQTHVAGERAFVDYAGPTLKIHIHEPQEVRTAQIFVGILGASNYTYAEAHWSQQLPNWIAAHTRMFDFFGGVPQIVVCDNLKSAVTKASRTEPVLHPAYQHMAAHYGTVIVPARPKKPKDKSKVENAVLVVERWILFRLRKHVFTSLEEANVAIRALLLDLNARKFQRLAGCRQSQFELLDRPALQALPGQPFEYTEFHRTRVGMDGYFSVAGGTYTAPRNLSMQAIDLRVTAGTIEVLHKGVRVASHARTYSDVPVVDPQHVKSTDWYFANWNAEHELEWARSIGPSTLTFLEALLTKRPIKEQGYRNALATKRLAKDYGDARLEAACGRAISVGASSIASVRSILSRGLDQHQVPNEEPKEANFDHANIRGSDYYH